VQTEIYQVLARTQPTFDASMLVHFRERIDINLVNKINRPIIRGKAGKRTVTDADL
jgi:hypothetical protein